MKKVIFTSSAGGHLTELLRLEKLFCEYEYLIITEKTATTQSIVEKYPHAYLKYGSRQYIFRYLFIICYNIMKTIQVLHHFKPDTIVTTGAHTGGIVAYIGKKFFKTRVIYIESMAKTKELSVTGKNIYKIADKFYVQWEELSNKYEKAQYLGRLM